MPASSPNDKEIGLIGHINAAVTNMRLYPPTSALIQKSVSRLEAAFEEIFGHWGTLTYAESEKNLLVQGEPLSTKEQKKPQIRSFLSLLRELGIKSVSFEKGLAGAEIQTFLHLLSAPAEEGTSAGGGFSGRLAGAELPHIRVDERIYVEHNADRSILAGMQVGHEVIERAVFGDTAVSKKSRDRLREMAKDPEWVSHVFEAGVRHLVSESTDMSQEAIRERLSGLIDAVGHISSRKRKDLLIDITRTMAETKEAEVFAALSRNVAAIFGKGDFREAAGSMDRHTFQKIYRRLVGSLQASPSEVDPQLRQTLELMGRVGKEKRFEASDRESGPEERGVDGASASIAGIEAEGLQSLFARIFKGDVSVLPRLEALEGADEAFSKLASEGRQTTLRLLAARLAEGLSLTDPEVRSSAAEVFKKFDRLLAESGRTSERVELGAALTAWASRQAGLSETFETVSRHLQELSLELIREGRVRDVVPILEVYRRMKSGDLSADEALQAFSANLLQSLVTEDILDLLLRKKGEESLDQQTEDVCRLLCDNETFVGRLLDRLHDSPNRTERNRVIQLVTRIGKPAVGAVLQRLSRKGPWYYRRNLVLLLGRIGDEEHVETIERHLDDSDFRVQREAVLALQNLCGREAGKRFLQHLDRINDDVKPVIISVLGMIDYQQAIPYLMMKLEKRDLGKTKEAKAAINAKICETLARMGDARVVPLLTKIARPKKLMGSLTYDPRVREAAVRALSEFDRKEKQTPR
jgi:hypothetical protein